MDKITIREAVPDDHQRIVEVMVDWWGGRDLRSSVHKIFLIHFCNTSFIAEDEGKLAGFLVGFFSQTEPDTGFIHFAGVHPDWRKKGIARRLYKQFYDCCLQSGRGTVKLCTAPVNRLSINFHQALGFVIEEGDAVVEGIEVSHTFIDSHSPLVLFRKQLT